MFLAAEEEDLRFKTLPANVGEVPGVPFTRPADEGRAWAWDAFVEAGTRLHELRGELDAARVALSALGVGSGVETVAELLRREAAVLWLVDLCESKMHAAAERLRAHQTRAVRPEETHEQNSTLALTSRRIAFENAMRPYAPKIEAARFYVAGASTPPLREWGRLELRSLERRRALLADGYASGVNSPDELARPIALATAAMYDARGEMKAEHVVLFGGPGAERSEAERDRLVNTFGFTAEEIAAEREVLAAMG